MHCGDQRHAGLCLGYVPALAYGSCRVSVQGTTLRASDLHNARATILNPFSKGYIYWIKTLQWRHNERDAVSNHQPHDCLLNCLFRRKSKKTSKLRVTGLCVVKIHRGPVNSPHKWPVMRKMFPFDDVIMIHWIMCTTGCRTFAMGQQHGVNKIMQTTFSNSLFLMRIVVFYLTMWQDWFSLGLSTFLATSHCLN